MIRKGFTLIELLIVIALLAVLSVAVVLVINPAELLRQARDSTRISDLAAVNSAISLYLSDVADPQLGGPNDTLGACSVLTERCTAGTAGRNSGGTCSTNVTTTVNGLGWVGANLSAISYGAPISRLPLDPVSPQGSTNCGTGNQSCFYSFICNGTNYELNAAMESTKFRNGGPSNVESTDGGSNNDVYEVGNSLAL